MYLWMYMYPAFRLIPAKSKCAEFFKNERLENCRSEFLFYAYIPTYVHTSLTIRIQIFWFCAE
jgi:hypothetical protein